MQKETMNTRWLSPHELSAWVRFASVLELLPGVLDAQLRRDSELTHFDYRVISLLSETEEHTMRMGSLARLTNSTLPRLSHVVHRLEERGYVERVPCPEDKRATNARLTERGWQKVLEAAPGHVQAVREHVLDALTPEQVAQLERITEQIMHRLDPDGELRPVSGSGAPQRTG